MAGPRIIRECADLGTIALQTDDTSPTIEIDAFASGEVFIPAGSGLTTLTYFVDYRGVRYIAQDTAGAAVSQTVAAGKSYPLPASVMGAGLIQIRGNVAGNVTIVVKG